MGQFKEYGRVYYKNKLVVLGEEELDDEAMKINTGYFLEDGELVPLSTHPQDELIIARTFYLYSPAVDFDAAKNIENGMNKNPLTLGEINIDEYLPDCEVIEAKAIGDMLKRIQRVFPFVSAENLIERLPNLKIESNEKLPNITAAYFKPKDNAFGLCKKSFNDELGKAYTIHELSHMLGARVNKDEFGDEKYLACTGFADPYSNGVGITEGLNEILSSVARLGEPISYDDEVRLATLYYTSSDGAQEVIKEFYRGNINYLRGVSQDEFMCKKFIKNMDYQTWATRYEAERRILISNELKKNILNNIGKEFGKDFELDEKLVKTINEEVGLYIKTNVKPDFTKSNFIGNAQYALLDKVEEKLLDEDISTEYKSLLIDSAFKCMIFPSDVNSKYEDIIELKELRGCEERFYGILLDMGLDEDEIANITNMCQTSSDAPQRAKAATFDDEDLAKLADNLYGEIETDEASFEDEFDDLDD